jgi:hypothetical protein
MLLHFPFSSSF